MEKVKCLVVGDGAVGKTSLLIRYHTKEFPHEYIPTVFDQHETTQVVSGREVGIEFWDTAGEEEYDRLRPLSYSNSNVFLICFSVANQHSFENVKKKWVTEVRHYCPDVPIILVATKCDLRDDTAAVEKLGADAKLISLSEGKELAKSLLFSKYMETSALKGIGINELALEAAAIGCNSPPSPDIIYQKKRNCDVM